MHQKTSLTPVFKRGDATYTANYRPIAVGEPLIRLYASILALGAVHRAARPQISHSSRLQAGAQHHPSDFVLQHVIDKHKRLKSLMYLCFVDLKSAYDRVQWHVGMVCNVGMVCLYTLQI